MSKRFLVFIFVFFVSAAVGVAEPMDPAPLRKDPALSGILSFLVTGAGQVYNGEYLKGGVFFGVSIFGAALYVSALGDDDDVDSDKETRAAVGGLILLGGWSSSIVDAVISAKRINKENRAHLIELGSSKRVGLDPMIRRGGVGALATVHF